ncbi:MAG: hypothetical protein BWY76_03293 [bacterium ADurb.Bin429]|nr:MAG: hypothetical protein BWY76_03293 [bacterium ADurb.Bin429]
MRRQRPIGISIAQAMHHNHVVAARLFQRQCLTLQAGLAQHIQDEAIVSEAFCHLVVALASLGAGQQHRGRTAAGLHPLRDGETAQQTHA